MNNREKIAKAVERRKAKQRNVVVSSSTAGWVKDKVTGKTHPIIGDLQQYFVDAVAERNKDRDTAHIHPSEISKNYWCQRQTQYRISDTPEDPDYEPSTLFWRLASIYEEGHEIHEKHQRAFWEMGVLEGSWRCNRCSHRWWAVSPVVCARCGTLNISYAEVPIEYPKYKLIGHTDGLHFNGVKRVNLEMKSIGVRSIEMEVPEIYQRWKESNGDLRGLWGAIKMPFPSHQRQGQIYVATLKAMGIDVDETLFIYEFKATQEIKGFIVRYNEKLAQGLLDRAADILNAIDEGVVVDRPQWAHDKHKECKDCPFYQRCWSTS